MKLIKIESKSKVIEVLESNQVKRYIVPISAKSTKYGVPYGLPLAALIEKKTGKRMAQLIENEVHNRGLWTKEEILNSPKAVLSALQKAYGVDTQEILAIARRGNNG